MNVIHETRDGNGLRNGCRKMRHFWVVARLCLALGALVLPVHGAGEPQPAASEMTLKTLVPQLGSANEPERAAAVTALVKMGPVSLKTVLDGFAAGSVTYRKAAVTVISGLKQDKGYTALVDLLLTEPDPEVRAYAADVLRLSASPAVRQWVLGLLQNADPKIRNNAAEIARSIGYAGFVDDLLKMLERQLQERRNRSAGGMMDINLKSTNFKGYDTFSTDYVVGGKKVRQATKMPVFKSVKVNTVIALPATKALVTLTGEDYGESLKKWRHWWKENKKSLQKTGNPPPDHSP